MLGHILNLMYFQKTSAPLLTAEVNELRKLLDKFEIDSTITPVTSGPRITNMSNMFGLGTVASPSNSLYTSNSSSLPAAEHKNQKQDKNELILVNDQELETPGTAYGLRAKLPKPSSTRTRRSNNKPTELKPMVEIHAKRLKTTVDNLNFKFSGSRSDGFSGLNSGHDLSNSQSKIKIAEHVIGKF